MSPLPSTAVLDALPDPRRQTANQLPRLTDILTSATCAVTGGADRWEAIAAYGQAKESFFRRFLPLPHGIPRADPFARVFATLGPAAFSQAFGRWTAAAGEGTGLVPTARGGKAARRAQQNPATGCLTVVSAWAPAPRLTLGPGAVPDGPHARGVIPELLRTLDRAGALVTIDAAGCQVADARIVREQGGRSRAANRRCTTRSRPCSPRRANATWSGGDGRAGGGGGGARSARGAVRDGPHRPGGTARRVAGRGGRGTGEPRAGGGREEHQYAPLLSHELRRHSGGGRRLDPRSLGHRERVALGARRGVP